jgi:hypothetical protein
MMQVGWQALVGRSFPWVQGELLRHGARGGLSHQSNHVGPLSVDVSQFGLVDWVVAWRLECGTYPI